MVVRKYDRDIVGMANTAVAAMPSNSIVGLTDAVSALANNAGQIFTSMAKVEEQQDANFLSKATSRFNAQSAEMTKQVMMDYADNPIAGAKEAKKRNKALWDSIMADAPSSNAVIAGQSFFDDHSKVEDIRLENWQKKQVIENTISTLDQSSLSIYQYAFNNPHDMAGAIKQQQSLLAGVRGVLPSTAIATLTRDMNKQIASSVILGLNHTNSLNGFQQSLSLLQDKGFTSLLSPRDIMSLEYETKGQLAGYINTQKSIENERVKQVAELAQYEAVQQSLHDGSAALSLDRDDKYAKQAVQTYFSKATTEDGMQLIPGVQACDDKSIGMALHAITSTEILPDNMQSTINNMAKYGTGEQKLKAAYMVGEINKNPRLSHLSSKFDQYTKAMAAIANEARGSNMPTKSILELIETQMNVSNQVVLDIRKKQADELVKKQDVSKAVLPDESFWDSIFGPEINVANPSADKDKSVFKSGIIPDLFSRDVSPLAGSLTYTAMNDEFKTLFTNYYMITGNEQASFNAAQSDMRGIWRPSSINQGRENNLVMERLPVDFVYGVEGEDNAKIIKDKLVKEINQSILRKPSDSMLDNVMQKMFGVSQDVSDFVIMADSQTMQEYKGGKGKPTYRVMINTGNGFSIWVDEKGREKRWYPDMSDIKDAQKQKKADELNDITAKLIGK